MHPFTTFLTHIAASLTGCGNWRGYASKAAEERRQRFSKTRSMIIPIDLSFFFPLQMEIGTKNMVWEKMYY